MHTREPAVAGTFYPADRVRLQAAIQHLLVEAHDAGLPQVRGLIVPHAGYRYSGPIAASGFKQLRRSDTQGLRTVFLLGPAHYVYVNTIALAPHQRFATPLGVVDQNEPVVDSLLADRSVFQALPLAHEPEHCLEVELPFLQTVLDDFLLVAMLCGEPPIDRAAADLAALLGPDDLVVVSSDLSHFHAYREAQSLDRALLSSLIAGDTNMTATGEACGLQPILILMRLAQLRGWHPTLLDYRNSGDTAGDRSRVVGYAAVAYTETPWSSASLRSSSISP